jgi:hypothetical protein
MVTPALLLTLNLIHIILGTFGVAFLANVLSTAPSDAYTFLAAALGCAVVGWLLLAIGGPMSAPAAINANAMRLRACSALAFTGFALYAVAGTLGSYVYSFYPDTMLLWTEVFVLVASIAAISLGVGALYVVRTAAAPASDLPALAAPALDLPALDTLAPAP